MALYFILGCLFVLAIGFCIFVRWDTYRFNRMTPEKRREFNRRRESRLNADWVERRGTLFSGLAAPANTRSNHHWVSHVWRRDRLK